MLLLILILLSFSTSASSQNNRQLSFTCRVARKPECNKVHFVPGYHVLGQGFDIVTMKQTRAQLLDLQKLSTRGDSCIICYNPYVTKPWQKLPLVMVDWRPQSSCSRMISSEISQSFTSLAEVAASEVKNDWEAGLELHFHGVDAKLIMAGSQSQVSKFGESKTRKDRYSFIKHHMSCVYYSFRLSYLLFLSENLKQALKSLPPIYNASTQDDYRRLINIYGTHYISQADVGGQVLLINAIKTCQVSMDGMSVDKLKDCLNIEASVAVSGSAEASARASACKELSQKSNRGESFYQTFDERSWEVRGGEITFEQLSFNLRNGKGMASFDTWMESLKTNPDIVTYSLAPIHNLVGITGPQRESLRKAISDYIMEKALRRNCSCPSDSKRSPGRECDCICSDNASKNINCCPSKWGLAKVVVTVRYAFDLWGDYLTKTDAFVKISLGMVSVRTHTIWNNNNPNWGSRFDLDVLELSLMSSLKVEVWDEDNKHDDDLLGACQKPVSSGLKDHICYFDHGTVTFRVSVQCLPHLTGSHCREYAASTT